jgi:hypothetical protein
MFNVTTPNTLYAPACALGCLYRVRVAPSRSLRRLKAGYRVVVSLETAADVRVTPEGSARRATSDQALAESQNQGDRHEGRPLEQCCLRNGIYAKEPIWYVAASANVEKPKWIS